MKTEYDELKLKIRQLQAELDSCRRQLQHEMDEHKRTAKALADASRQAGQKEDGVPREKLRKVLETAGEVCHDLNQPLMAVSGYCELVMMDIDGDHPLYIQLNKMKEQVERMGIISRRLMEIIRKEALACL